MLSARIRPRGGGAPRYLNAVDESGALFIVDYPAIAFLSLALVSLASVIAGRPWTVLIARRTTEREAWGHPLFREANIVLSLVWTVMFGATAFAFRIGDGGALGFGATLLNTGLGLVSPWLGKRYAAWRAPAYREYG